VKDSSIPNSDDNCIKLTVGAFVFVPLDDDGSVNLKGIEEISGHDVRLACNRDICKILSPNKSLFLDDDEIGPIIAFDISLYDQRGHEIRHGQSVYGNDDDGDDDIGAVSNMNPRFMNQPSPTVSPISIKRPPSESDTDSVSESIVQGDIYGSSLRLHEKYYSLDKASCIEPVVAVSDTKGDNFSRTSLLQRTMSVNLQKNKHDSEVFTLAKKISSYKQVQQLPINTKDLTRGARSRLNRHGFHTGHDVTTTPMTAAVDIEHEVRDPLCLNDVSIQFAGFRYLSMKDGPKKSRAIYISYQFYTCPFTRTEVLRVLPAEEGEVGVLVRDDPRVRSEPSLSIHHLVDCSQVSPCERYEFAEYLGTKILYADVWDADSRLLLGTCAIPLRRLLRQGESSVKCAIECDIIDWDSCVDHQIGISSMNIVLNGPIIGKTLGSLNIIMSNSGRQGSRSTYCAESKDSTDADLNWRVRNGAETKSTLSRPRNSVRAKPLSECEPKLSKALYDRRNQSNHRATSSSRSLFDKRGCETEQTITYDELIRLFKRFEGPVKGTVQYTGPLLRLLEVPSLEMSTSKLVKILSHMKKIGLPFKSVSL